MNESTQKLVEALEAEKSPRLKKLIKKAKAEHFHDFDSPLEMPSVELFRELVAYDFPELAARVVNGDFDATKEESERWSNSFDGMETFDDPKAVEQAKQVAMLMCRAEGQSWDEKGWQEMISEKRISNE